MAGRDTVLVRCQYGAGYYKGSPFKEGDTFKVSRYFLELHPDRFVALQGKPGPKPRKEPEPTAETEIGAD